MRARLLPLAVIVAALLVPTHASAQPVAKPSARAGATVTVADMMFSPASVTVGLGQTVTWSFPDAISHTTTSNQSFWDSGAKSGGASYSRAFTSAGTYAYHCSIHAMMHGAVRVPVAITAPTSIKRVLRWSTGPAGAGTSFDVQVKKGSGPWSNFRVDTTKPRGSYKHAEASVTYRVRARTTLNGASSGWSTPVAFSVS